jgi:long-chain fatty acid transport protein
MRILTLAVAVMLLLASSSGSLYASGFENTGVGVTARGMGGAFRAIADDWSAAYYNPAGYAYIVDNQLGGSWSFTLFRDQITPRYAAVDSFANEYGWGIANGQTIYNFHRILDKPSAGFVVRLPMMGGETVFGLSAFQPFDQSLRWRMYALDASLLRAYNEDAVGNLSLPGTDYLIDLDVVAFQATAAREFNEGKLAVGVGLQLLRGDLWCSDLVFRDNPRGDVNEMVDNRPRDRVPEYADNEGRGWGFGLRGGVIWKPTDKLDVAATAYLPFDITIKGETFFTFIMPKAQYLWGDVVPNSADFLFVSGQIPTQASDFETKLKLPASLAFGVAYHATEKLTVALDAEYTLWSKYDGLKFSYSNFAGTPHYLDSVLVDGGWVKSVRLFEPEFFQADLANPVDWDNAGKVSLGARYLLHPKLTLLAGVCADQSPARNSIYFTPQFMDLGTKKTFNAGGILHINQWDIGVITSYTDFPDINLVGLADADSNDTFDNFPGAYKADTYETVLSLGYRF